MNWFGRTERERWRSPVALARLQPSLGLPGLDAASAELYGAVIPRGASVPRFAPDRPRRNAWMSPYELAQHAYLPGQLILGKFGGRFLGHLDDRPMVTIAGARAGKTSTVLEPNLYLYPGSMLILDPKAELAKTARHRRLLGHDVHILDPFGENSACFNPLDEIDPASPTVVDDVATITQALIIDDGDAKAKHWNDSARAILLGLILLTLTLPPAERSLVTMRELLCLTSIRLRKVVRRQQAQAKKDGAYFNENTVALETLLGAMTKAGRVYGGVLAAIGNRFLGMPKTERGSVFSTATVQTDFLDSLPLRNISKRSDFKLSALRSDRPTTICLCLPVGRMESHSRWLRLVVQLSCIVLERMGPYPRDRPPILYLMEEFATLGHMELMERAAAYFPGFGIKLWVILQSLTQLQRYYPASWETFLGNAGLVQNFASGDQATLEYIARRIEDLMVPFELRAAFSRERFSQLLMMEGKPPAAALRLGHEDVAGIRAMLELRALNVRQLRDPKDSRSNR